MLGLTSSGLHSNGFSLVRKIVELGGLEWDGTAPFNGEQTVAEALLEPTRIYVKPLLAAIRETGAVKGLTHITGGGLLENIPRVLPDGLHAHVDAGSWPQPRLMAFLQAQGNIEPEEMARTFNCGIGMVLAVSEADVDAVTADLENASETVFRIGEVASGTKGCTVSGSSDQWSAMQDWSATHNG